MAQLDVPASRDDHIQGPDNAPVTLVENGDYQCPYCGEAHPIVTALRRRFGDQLRFVFRHFPLTEIHPLAEPAAETAEFSGVQGHFWEIHGALYENQRMHSLTTEPYRTSRSSASTSRSDEAMML
jgi:protein-disulfide isomerase